MLIRSLESESLSESLNGRLRKAGAAIRIADLNSFWACRTVVARIYDRPKGTANGRYLIAAHDIDLNDRDTLSEITTINPTLENALAGGIVGALIAALPGFIDLTDLQNPKTITIAIWHMTINLLAVALYCVNFWLRMHRAGWLGGELVYVRGVAVKQPPDQSI